jgi:HSP20 family protein
MSSRFLIPFGGKGLMGFDSLLDLHRDMNRLFDDAFRGAGTAGSQLSAGGVNALRLDVHETDSEFCVSADLPGVDKSHVDLRLEGDMLTINGERNEQRDDKQQNWHLAERSWGRYQRTIQLPFAPDPAQVKAEFKDGVLNIHLPKQAQLERGHRIQIAGGDEPAKAVQPTLGNEQHRPGVGASTAAAGH